MAGGINSLNNTLGNLKNTIETRINAEQVKTVVAGVKTVTQYIDKNGKDITQAINSLQTILDNINSVGDLIKANEKLVRIAGTCLVAAAAVSYLTPLLSLMAEHQKAKESKEFRDKLLTHLNSIEAELLQQTRLQSANYLLNYNKSKQKNYDFGEDESRLEYQAKVARMNLDNIPVVDREILKGYADNLMETLYTKACNPLDWITIELTPQAVSASFSFEKEKLYQEFPKSDPTELNYAGVKKLYGDAITDKAMKAGIQFAFPLLNQLVMDLYQIADVQPLAGLLAITNYLLFDDDWQNCENEIAVDQDHIDELKQALSIELSNRIKETLQREVTNEIPDSVIQIVRNRAILSSYKQCKSNFSFYYRMYKEVVTGLQHSFAMGVIPEEGMKVGNLASHSQLETYSISNALYERPVKTAAQAISLPFIGGFSLFVRGAIEVTEFVEKSITGFNP